MNTPTPAQALGEVIRVAAKAGGWKRIPLDDLHVPVPESGCWIWIGAENGKGYGAVYDKSLKKTETAHRFFYRQEHGAIPNGALICHKCDTRLCVNPKHLYAGTPASNMQDKANRGTVKGERHSNAALTNEVVAAIREMRKTEKVSVVARHFGINESTVSKLALRRRWTHV